ncbi:MAG: putative DNA binding domain-containing protein [Thermodesulfovibrionia bacterium]|nr:putative DNA binding domain-containing protein [Thermodesulfovibrionia bacterium]
MNIKEILRSPESRMLEFKRKLPKHRNNILKTIVGFANGSGGNIYIGVNDDRSVCGIENEPFDLEESLSSFFYDSISPTPNIFYQTISVEQKTVFLIKVLPGANKPYFIRKDGPEDGTFIRVGSTNRKADGHILAELRRQARNISLDSEVETSFNCDIFDLQILNTFLNWRELTIKPSIDFLVKNSFAHKFNHICHPTLGGLLLFCSELPENYEYAGFRVSRFRNDTRSDLIRSEFINCGLLLMPQRVMEFIFLYLEKNVHIEGLQRKETHDIPVSALREAITNAICHRDYSITGSQNKLDVFSDRVEITSPGVLPVGITLADLGLGTSEIRNRQIVKTFRQAGFIEQLGTGIIRIREACRQQGLVEPKFDEVGSFFKVTLFRPKIVMPAEVQTVFDLIKRRGFMSSREIASHLKIHQNTSLKRLKWLQKNGLIKKKGSGTKVKYGI